MTRFREQRTEARHLAALAAPVVLTQFATMLMGVVDTLMVARLGTRAMAATSLGNVWVWGTLVFGMGVILGLDPIVSQAHGRGDGPSTGLALQRGILLALALSVPLAFLWTRAGPALRLAGQDPELAVHAQTFVLWQIPGIPAFLVYTALRQYLSGRGIMRPAMWVAWAANGVNLFLDWVLIFGHLGFAPRGIAGAGLATGLSRVFMMVALTSLVLGGRLHHGAWPGWSRLAFSRSGLADILRIGLPVGAQFGLEVWGFHIATLLAGLLGATALAAHAIVLNLASLSFMVPLGISIAASARIGNLIGAGDRSGAARAANVALVLGAGVMTASAVLFLCLRHQLPRLWHPEAAVLAAAAGLLPVAAAFQVFDGTQAVGCGVLRGGGDTRPAMWFNLIGYYGLALPLGALLAFHLGWGLPGLWWGLTLGLMAVAGMLVSRIRKHGPGAPLGEEKR